MQASTLSMTSFFDSLTDPRREHLRLHKLEDIIVLTLCAVISNADTWADVQRYGKQKLDWLKSFLELPNGIPSHDTIGRFFSLLDPQAFQECFLRWVQAAVEASDGRLIAIDGKTLRRSRDKPSGRSALHLVGAWVSENNMILGQQAVDAKSNEITAIPELLRILQLQGSVVTIDAMGCQREIASQIRDQEGDYLFSLKNNQPTLFEQTVETFAEGLDTDFAALTHCTWTSEDTGHGRKERRQYFVVEVPEAMKQQFSDWKDLRTLGMVYSERQVGTNAVSEECRYFISSLPLDAERFAEAVRGHWAIENGLHWTLDVGFDEDGSRVRKDHAPENFGWIRRLALSLLKNESTAKGGIASKRMQAGWSNEYLLKVLQQLLLQ